MRFKTLLQSAGLVFVGLVGGAFLKGIIRDPNPTPLPLLPEIRPKDEGDEQRLADIERELARLRAERSISATASDAGLVVKATEEHRKESGPPPEVGFEAHKKFLNDRFTARLDDFAKEATDPSWAPEMTRTVMSGMETMANLSDGGVRYRIADVACKTSMCLATLEFDNFKSAQQHYQRIVESHRAKCARGTLLPEPGDPKAPYRAKFVFECKRGDQTVSRE